jgi:putative membrane protein
MHPSRHRHRSSKPAPGPHHTSAVSLDQTKDTHSLLKGLLAGAIGGLVATGAKTLAEKVYPPRVHGEPEPPEVMAEKVAGQPLDHETKTIASESIHWVFGIAAGAFYGVLAELYPAITAKSGATFGLTLMSLTHEGALPALGLAEPPQDQTFRERTSEGATHMVYGVVTEKVRSLVRGALD